MTGTNKINMFLAFGKNDSFMSDEMGKHRRMCNCIITNIDRDNERCESNT